MRYPDGHDPTLGMALAVLADIGAQYFPLDRYPDGHEPFLGTGTCAKAMLLEAITTMKEMIKALRIIPHSF